MANVNGQGFYTNNQCVGMGVKQCLLPEPPNTTPPPDRNGPIALDNFEFAPPRQTNNSFGMMVLNLFSLNCASTPEPTHPQRPEFETPDITRIATSEENVETILPVLNSDGRFVAFQSKNIIFIHDRQTGKPGQISVSRDGGNPDGENSWPSISADGRFVSFTSSATNLTNDAHNGKVNIFLRDRQGGNKQEGETILVSTPNTGNKVNGDSFMSSISADGRYVAFNSNATNLTTSGTENSALDNVFVYDRTTKKIKCVSFSPDGWAANGGSGAPAISGDGNFVAFGSWATNLFSAPTGGHYNVFLHNMLTGATKMISGQPDGKGFLNNDISRPNISADGKSMAFYSWATNVVPGSESGWNRLFVMDTEIMAFNKCSNIKMGKYNSYDCKNKTTGENSCIISEPSFSTDGRYVTFASGQKLSSDDENGHTDIFVCDNKTGDIKLVSRAMKDEKTIVGKNLFPSISGDGKSIAFIAQTWTDQYFLEDIFVAKNPFISE